jgi:hypothetical protein
MCGLVDDFHDRLAEDIFDRLMSYLRVHAAPAKARCGTFLCRCRAMFFAVDRGSEAALSRALSNGD